MASPSSSTGPSPSAQGQAATQKRLTETMVALVREFNNSKGFQDIAALVSERDVLALKNRKLELELKDALTAETRNLDAIQKVKNENMAVKNAHTQMESEVKTAQAKESQAVSQRQEAQKEVAALKQQLSANASKITETLNSKLEKEADIRKLTDKMEKMEESFRKTKADLETTNQTNVAQLRTLLNTATEELTNLKSLALPLKEQTDKQIPLKQLGTMFDDAHHLVARFFGQAELSDYGFSTVQWHSLTKLGCLEGIPLPPTNSDAAKQMRAAAVLRVLAEAASAHICQPVHIPHGGTAVADLLDTIEQLDPRRAGYLRGVLLGIEPAAQQDNGKKRAAAAFKDAYDSVSFMLDDSSRKAFGRALLEWFDRVCSSWRSLQRFDGRYQALFDPENEELVLEDWEPLPGAPPALPARTRGQAAANGAAAHGAHVKPSPKAELTKLADIEAQIWPAFLVVTTAGKLEPVKPGYVLVKAQTAAADQELSSRASPEASLDAHRMRRGQRRGIIPANGANNTRERLDTFLC